MQQDEMWVLGLVVGVYLVIENILSNIIFDWNW